MNKLLTIVIVLTSFNLFPQMKSTDVGWATFYNEASEVFSPEFQNEMANQLMLKFNAMVGIENYASEKKFMLFVGMRELKTMYQDGYAFSLVEVIAPNSYSKTLTAYWKAQDNKKIVSSDSANFQNVEFGWCADFDKEFFRSFTKENVIKTINGIELSFKYVSDVQLYPDLTISFEFKQQPNNSQIEEINNILVSTYTESYVSRISEYEGNYSTMIDFQGTEVQIGLNQIEQFILDLNSNEVSKIIESITIN